jgi:Fe-S-cluster containining protein
MIHPVHWIAERFASTYARWGTYDSLRASILRQTSLRRCRLDAAVLCVACRPVRCCRELEVELTPAEHKSGLYHVDAERLRRTGKPVLERGEHGCVYLVDDLCAIYEHRPTLCRDYDCVRDSRMHVTWPAS